MSNILYKLGYIGTWSCIRWNRVQVGFESDFNSLDHLYNMRVPHITYVNSIAAGAQGEPMACVGAYDGRCCGIIGEEHL
jgi:hypothetical protein